MEGSLGGGAPRSVQGKENLDIMVQDIAASATLNWSGSC